MAKGVELMIWKPGQSLDDVVLEAVLNALGYHGYNRSYTAFALKVPVRTLREMIRRYKSEGYFIPARSKGRQKKPVGYTPPKERGGTWG